MFPFFQSQSASGADDRKMLQALLDTIVDSVFVIDRKGTIQSVNPTALRAFGYSSEELSGKNVKILIPESYQPDNDSSLKCSEETDVSKILGSTDRELTACRKDGSRFPIELSVSEMRDADQAYYVGIVRDISKCKKAEKERDSLIEALRASNEELDEFASIVSHDLREPLRGLGNHAQFLREDFEKTLGEDGAARLQRMQFLCRRTEQLIKELHSFSRLGHAELRRRVVDLNRELGEVRMMMKEFLDTNSAQVVIPEPLPEFPCDAVRIRKVFENLIENGVKYNESAEKRIEVGYLLERSDYKKVFYVKDNGIGIDEAHWSEVYKMFKRLNPQDESRPGTGSGLAFVKRIVERHNGAIWIESKKACGSTFYFTLGNP